MRTSMPRQVNAALALAVFASITLAGATPTPTTEASSAKFLLVTQCDGVSAFDESGFVRMAWTALQELEQEELGISVARTKCTTEEDVVQWGRDGVDHVILLGWGPIMEVSPLAYLLPHVKFSGVDDVPENLDEYENVQAVTFAEDEGAFLAGVLAAGVSRSGHVGVVAGPPFPALRRFTMGFLRGVKFACADCHVHSQYTSVFTMPEVGAPVAEYMVTELGVDVLFGAAGDTGLGALQQALTHPDVLVIGVDTDEFLDTFDGGASAGSDRLVSSVMKGIDTAVRKIVLEHLDGHFNPRTVVQLDFNNNGLALAPCHLACKWLTAEVNRTVAVAADKVAAGLVSANLEPSGSTRLRDFYPPDAPGNSWSRLAHTGLPPPPLRAAATARGDCLGDDCVYVFGGNSEGADLRGSGDLYTFNLNALAWRRHTPRNLLTGAAPPPRSGATLTPLAEGPGLALFGGLSAQGSRLGDLWLYVPAAPFVRPYETFLEVTAAAATATAAGAAAATGDEAAASAAWPEPRVGHAAASGTAAGSLVVFGGSDADSVLRNDLWLAVVTLVEPPSSPVGSSNSASGTATARWTRLCSACPPSARRDAVLVAHGEHLYLSGGRGTTGAPLGDLWRAKVHAVAGSGAAAVDWVAMEPMPLARSNHAGALMTVLTGSGQREPVVALVGGHVPATSTVKARSGVDYYIPRSGKWLSVASFAPEEAGDDLLQLCGSNSSGGDGQGGGEHRVGARVKAYLDRRAHVATSVEPRSAGAHDGGGSGSSSKLLVFGGQGAGGELLLEVELFHPNENLVKEDLQLSAPVQALSRMLAAVNMALATAFGTWTILNRNRAVVRASQVRFLFMIAVGGAVSSSAIIPLTVDDSGDADGLARTGDYAPGNRACMSALWLFGTGWMTSFAFLFAKMWRVTTMFDSAMTGIARISNLQLFLVAGSLLGVEWAVLLAMEVLAPLELHRRAVAFDELGQVTLSALSCRSDLGSTFLAILVSYHLGVLFYGAYLCYRARNIQSTFAESKYVTVALVSNLQVMCIATPVLLIVADNPISATFIQSGIIFLNDLSVLLLIFVPKILADRKNIAWTELVQKARTRSVVNLGSGKLHSLPSDGAVHSARRTSTAVGVHPIGSAALESSLTHSESMDQLSH